MKIRSVLNGEGFEAEITTDHSASSCGIPVLVIAGEPIGPAETATEWHSGGRRFDLDRLHHSKQKTYTRRERPYQAA